MTDILLQLSDTSKLRDVSSTVCLNTVVPTIDMECVSVVDYFQSGDDDQLEHSTFAQLFTAREMLALQALH